MMKREWTGLVIGAWILISPWLLGFASLGLMKWSNVLAGLVLVLMSAWALFGKEPKSDL